MKYTLTEAQSNCQIALDTCDNCTIIKSIRSGKTLTVLDYALKKNMKSILWVTPFLTNIDSLKNEIKKWSFKLNVIPITYNSLKKHENKSYDLIVLDECHRITEDAYKNIVKINYNKLVCMTGTYPKSLNKLVILETNLNCQIVFRYTIKDAISDGNVAPYKIQLIQKELDTSANILVETKNHKFYTSEQKNYNYYINKINIESLAKRRMMLTFSMMRLLNTLPSTIRYIKKYIEENSDKRVLIFVATQEMAEKCSEYCYYGGKSDKYYKLFQEKKINHLVLVEKATIGVTYEDLDGCLLTTINSSNSSVLQKIFRTILFRPNYIADIKILINKNTKQEGWIEKALEEL